MNSSASYFIHQHGLLLLAAGVADRVEHELLPRRVQDQVQSGEEARGCGAMCYSQHWRASPFQPVGLVLALNRDPARGSWPSCRCWPPPFSLTTLSDQGIVIHLPPFPRGPSSPSASPSSSPGVLTRSVLSLSVSWQSFSSFLLAAMSLLL